jgi:hypothetical protein
MLLSVVFVALFAGGMSAQTADAKRSVLFTLGENEEVAYGEYFVMQKMDGNRFACVIRNTGTGIRTLVFNGKRVVEGRWLDVHYLDVNKENGYVVEYSLQDMDYVNIRGKVLGPFEGVSQWGEGDKFAYYKEKGYTRDYYVYSNGVVGGPFDEVDFPSKTGAYADCEYLYVLADKWYAHYRNGSNKMARQPYFDHYERDGKWYVNINGVEREGHNGSIYEANLTKSGKYAYWYYEKGKSHVNINGEESRGYDGVEYLYLTEGGRYAYRYYENGKHHVNINGKESEGYEYVGYNIILAESGKYAYSYTENGKWYVNIDGVKKRGYNIEATDDGNFSFYYEGEDGKLYRNNNWIKNETEYLAGMQHCDFGDFALFGNTHTLGLERDNPDNIEIYSTDREHTLYSAYKYEYVVIDGVRCGAAPALYAWYDKGKNAFVWIGVVGWEVVFYE